MRKNPCGWRIKHRERFIYRANSGNPVVYLKLYNYPPYRQRVHIDKFPAGCRLKSKSLNSFFVFQKKLAQRGTISLEREVSVIPEPYFPHTQSWGRISDISLNIRVKYRESSKYWPLKSPSVLPRDGWFIEDDIYRWVKGASEHIRGKIKYPEVLDRRLGAEKAVLEGIGDCDEYTDLFVTLARMRGIPARRITGLFIAENGKFVEHHAWGEILTPKYGWITVDIALNNIGTHSINYVVLKIEEFNPELPDYQVQIKNKTTVHYKWDIPQTDVIPIFC